MLSVKRLYMSSLKQLLGVRNTTSNELALAESGLSYLKSMFRIFIHAEAEISSSFFR